MFSGSILLGSGIVAFLTVQKHGKLGAVVRWLVAHKVGGRVLNRAADHVTQVDQSLRLFYRERPWDLPCAMFWHMVGMGWSILKTWYFLLLLADGSFFAAAGIWLLGTWFNLLTFAIPMGIGVQEGSRVLAFKILGFEAALGLTYGVALRIEQLFWAAAGLAIYGVLLTEKGERRPFVRKEAAIDNPAVD